MKAFRKKRLEMAGFTIGTVQDFLRLSDGDVALIELKVSLIEMLKRVRAESRVTQQALAKKLGSSQSRVAKIEAGGADVTLDLICKALFALGVSRQALGKVIASKRAA